MFSSLGQVPLAHMSSDMSPALLAPNPAWWEGTAGIQFWRGLCKSYTLAGPRCISPHPWAPGLARLLGTFFPCVLLALAHCLSTVPMDRTHLAFILLACNGKEEVGRGSETRPESMWELKELLCPLPMMVSSVNPAVAIHAVLMRGGASVWR